MLLFAVAPGNFIQKGLKELMKQRMLGSSVGCHLEKFLNFELIKFRYPIVFSLGGGVSTPFASRLCHWHFGIIKLSGGNASSTFSQFELDLQGNKST